MTKHRLVEFAYAALVLFGLATCLSPSAHGEKGQGAKTEVRLQSVGVRNAAVDASAHGPA